MDIYVVFFCCMSGLDGLLLAPAEMSLAPIEIYLLRNVVHGRLKLG